MRGDDDVIKHDIISNKEGYNIEVREQEWKTKERTSKERISRVIPVTKGKDERTNDEKWSVGYNVYQVVIRKENLAHSFTEFNIWSIDWILSTVLSTFRTQYMKILSTKYFFGVHVLKYRT